MKLERVIISGGGTGGHIFPALAIANEISRRYPDAEILFVGAQDRMEMEKVPASGYKIIGLPVTGFPRKPNLGMLRFVVRLLKSYKLAKKIINQFNPQVAIGVGGFASGPLLRAASMKKIPSLIQEQNSYAGMTNKLLGRRVQTVCVAYEKMDRYFPAKKIVLTGNPVRENLLNKAADIQEARAFFGLKNTGKVILILGGSLGARSVNHAVLKNISMIAGEDVSVIWQTGSIYYREMLNALKDAVPANLHIFEFISRMDMAYAVADVVISRAGAGTISELCLVGKPSILIPSPNVAEDHQTKNAMALVEKDAAWMIADGEIDEKLFPGAVHLVNDERECRKLAEKISELARPDATRHIVDEAEKLLKQ
jgi:UDP-N-acetylglucosamine--N-acetylmuramyl-(pentapeptide) pyrophosphoryl-undecaprenol N-acetylglucosamine transferase